MRDADDAFAIAKEGNGTIWTLAEVAIAIEAFGDSVRATKQVFPGAEVTAVRPSGTAARLVIGSAPPVAATERETKPARKQLVRNHRSRSVGLPGLYAPLLELPSTKPPIDWQHGDDIPF